MPRALQMGPTAEIVCWYWRQPMLTQTRSANTAVQRRHCGFGDTHGSEARFLRGTTQHRRTARWANNCEEAERFRLEGAWRCGPCASSLSAGSGCDAPARRTAMPYGDHSIQRRARKEGATRSIGMYCRETFGCDFLCQGEYHGE